jgi:hypothetical protein
MILVPTRELALQTAQVCKELGKHTGVQVMVTTGGTSLKEDIMRLTQEIHMVVATPGRILDLSNKGVCILNNCRVLVMDEVSREGSRPAARGHRLGSEAARSAAGMQSAAAAAPAGSQRLCAAEAAVCNPFTYLPAVAHGNSSICLWT